MSHNIDQHGLASCHVHTGTYTIDRKISLLNNFAVKTKTTKKFNTWNNPLKLACRWSMNKCAHTSTPLEVNVRQAYIHNVTACLNCLKKIVDRTKPATTWKFLCELFSTWNVVSSTLKRTDGCKSTTKKQLCGGALLSRLSTLKLVSLLLVSGASLRRACSAPSNY